ncbi:MAG: hypothetical protein U1E77_13305 [Inhella sp.]
MGTPLGVQAQGRALALELFHPRVAELAPYPGTRRPTLKTLACAPAGRLHHPQWRKPR